MAARTTCSTVSAGLGPRRGAGLGAEVLFELHRLRHGGAEGVGREEYVEGSSGGGGVGVYRADAVIQQQQLEARLRLRGGPGTGTDNAQEEEEDGETHRWSVAGQAAPPESGRSLGRLDGARASDDARRSSSNMIH